MRVAFVHPDLGIGGAERLIVDAAVALQKRGHEVVLYTSHYSRQHCFEETKRTNISKLDVVVKGDFLPRHLFGYLHLLFATLRCFYLAAWIFLAHPHNYDVIIVDQISFSIPVLRRCARRVLFYCHFPDKLLAPPAKGKGKAWWIGSWRSIYRYYFDWAEEKTIGMAHRVLVNSHFTGTKFKQAFPSLRIKAEVLHPAIDPSSYGSAWKSSDSTGSPEIKELIPNDEGQKTLLSLNRFERKKNIDLALEAFLWLREHTEPEQFASLRLVIAGGYDPRVRENIEYLEELRQKCVKAGVSHFTIFPGIHHSNQSSGKVQVLFLPSISQNQRNYLMHSSLCLLYTPSFEHFGIVPVESMYCGLPVVAVNNGGPRETVINNITGFLCEATGQSFGLAVKRLLTRTEVDPVRMSVAAKKHVKSEFTMTQFTDKLEKILLSL